MWQERFGTWAHFSRSQPAKRDGHYWNPFGRIPSVFGSNMVVEINPPKQGINTNVQGVIARAPDNSCWVLHGGRLHPSSKRIKEKEFDRVIESSRESVWFSNGLVKGYHPVANLELDADDVQEQIANFVINCEKVRHSYVGKPEAAEQDDRVASAEKASSPERGGQYEVGPQAAKIVVKKHADVWHALTATLDKRGIEHSNGRVGKYGPDLRTIAEPYVLFEIKTELTTSDVQKAIGQLFFYEKLLNKMHKKVLVLPDQPNLETGKALKALGLSILRYQKRGRSIDFDSNDVKRLLAP